LEIVAANTEVSTLHRPASQGAFAGRKLHVVITTASTALSGGLTGFRTRLSGTVKPILAVGFETAAVLAFRTLGLAGSPHTSRALFTVWIRETGRRTSGQGGAASTTVRTAAPAVSTDPVATFAGVVAASTTWLESFGKPNRVTDCEFRHTKALL